MGAMHQCQVVLCSDLREPRAHADGPDCGCRNLIYGTRSASERQAQGVWSGGGHTGVCCGVCVLEPVSLL